METLVLDDNLLRSNLPVEPHTVAGMYVVLGWSSVGGALLKWYRDTFAHAEVAEAERLGRSAYDVILAEAVKGPSPVLILPHFVGSGTPRARPALQGRDPGLDPQHHRGQIVKAIIDSVTYEIKLSIDAMEAAGLAINELRAMGGGTKLDPVAANQGRHPGPAGSKRWMCPRRRAWAARCWPASPPASTPPPPRPSPTLCGSTGRTNRIRCCAAAAEKAAVYAGQDRRWWG